MPSAELEEPPSSRGDLQHEERRDIKSPVRYNRVGEICCPDEQHKLPLLTFYLQGIKKLADRRRCVDKVQGTMIYPFALALALVVQPQQHNHDATKNFIRLRSARRSSHVLYHDLLVCHHHAQHKHSRGILIS